MTLKKIEGIVERDATSGMKTGMVSAREPLDVVGIDAAANPAEVVRVLVRRKGANEFAVNRYAPTVDPPKRISIRVSCAEPQPAWRLQRPVRFEIRWLSVRKSLQKTCLWRFASNGG